MGCPMIRPSGLIETAMTPADLKQKFGDSQTAIAKAVGVNQSTVHDWFKRDHIPHARQLFIEEMTGGALKADPDAWRRDLPQPKTEPN